MNTSVRHSGSPAGRKKKLVRVYIPQPLLSELLAEAARLDRPISWLLQKAWSISKDRLREMREPEAPTAVGTLGAPQLPPRTSPVGATRVG